MLLVLCSFILTSSLITSATKKGAFQSMSENRFAGWTRGLASKNCYYHLQRHPCAESSYNILIPCLRFSHRHKHQPDTFILKEKKPVAVASRVKAIIEFLNFWHIICHVKLLLGNNGWWLWFSCSKFCIIWQDLLHADTAVSAPISARSRQTVLKYP